MRAGLLLLFVAATTACAADHPFGELEADDRDAAQDPADAAVDSVGGDLPAAPEADAASSPDLPPVDAASPGPGHELVYVVNHDSQTLSGFVVDLATQTATTVPGTPIPTGVYPYDVVIRPDG